MKMLLLLPLVLAGCNSNLDSLSKSLSPIATNQCVLYAHASDGSTIKEAVVAPEVIGTPGMQQSKLDEYAPFWTCIGLEVGNAWCECPSGSNKPFEDGALKLNPNHIVWLKR